MFSCLAKIRFAHQVKILFYKFQSNLLVNKIELLFLSLAKPSGNCSKWNNDDTGPFQGNNRQNNFYLNSGSFTSTTDSD